jgi:hypothetical protein
VKVRRFSYVGPEEIRVRALTGSPGVPVLSRESLVRWLAETPDVQREAGWVTYIVDLDGKLLVAPRRTEHVACASGRAVLAAGEMRFTRDGAVVEVTNNSTGYCPAEECWSSVRAALVSAEIAHPTSFTFTAHFRRCPRCGERNLVKDDWYSCALCDADLPAVWNFGD